MMVDKQGRLYEGDQLLYIIAKHRKMKKLLKGGVVGTIMTNLAIENRFKKMNIPFLRAQVGDRPGRPRQQRLALVPVTVSGRDGHDLGGLVKDPG